MNHKLNLLRVQENQNVWHFMTDLLKAQHLSGLSAIMEELNQKRQKVNSFYVKFLKEEFFTFVMIDDFFITTNQILEVTKMEFIN